MGGTAAAAPSVSEDATRAAAVDAATDNPAQANTAHVDPGQEYLNSFTAITGAFANDSAAGRIVGTAAGLVVGCPLGAVTGGTFTIAVPVLTPIGISGGSALGLLVGTFGSIVSGSHALAAVNG